MQDRLVSARYILLLLFIIALFSSCGSTKYLGAGELLFNGNIINVKSSGGGLKKIRDNIDQSLTLESKLATLAKQQPNKKALSIIPFKLWIYNRFYTENDSGFKHWMITKVGEPPVIFDSTLLRTSSALISNYLQTKGYLFPEVTYSYKVKRKRATAKYFVVTGPLYTIDSVFFPTDSSLLAWIVRGSMDKTLLKKGNAFDADMLGKEQARVQRNFQNTGYIYFRKEFIHFYADTTIGDHSVDVYVKVDQADSLPEQQIYTIKNIYVYSNFNPQNESKEIKYDTIYYDGIYFLSTKNFLDPDVLATAVFLSKDQRYSRGNYECTLHRISDLGVYKFANVRFVKADTNGVHNFLNCNMYLQPSKKHTIGGSVDVGNVESNFASGIKLSFGSKNVNNRANRIDVSATAGVQIPVFNADSLFYSFNLQLNYSIPKFAFPFIHPHISCYNNPVTKISLSTSFCN
ncbi:MAG: hypothetical protein LH473_07480, partial [Chitinophagales bacterium]|nr:hypothetical protein [Chitinophagales bacterium]